ncbi:CHAP domain-containing protein [Nonomuraea sp. NPDC002799]
MQKLIDLLESQIGYSEKSAGFTKFGDWYGKHVEFDADYSAAPWCDMYLSWAAHKLGYEDWVGQFAWTVAHAKWFKEQEAWGRTPKPGAIVFYDWSGSNRVDNIDHVGIVTRVEGNTIFTIEGNIDGGVAKRKERDTSKVVGYGYPERIKTRLDKAAAKKAADGAIQVPEESLSSLIPRDAGQPAPLPGQSAREDRIQSQTPGRGQAQTQGQTDGQTPAEAQGLTQDQAQGQPQGRPRDQTQNQTQDRTQDRTQSKTSPSKSASSADTGSPADSGPGSAAVSGSATTPQAGASSAPTTAKAGKHAKPATADTTAATAEPLPTHVDAAAGSPLPGLDSPALIGTALVAALALLAVAKTRRVRMAPAAAAAGPAPRPAGSHAARRRRRRFARKAPLLATAETTATGGLLATNPASLTATPATPGRLTTPNPLGAVTARHALGHGTSSDASRHSTSSDAFGRLTAPGSTRPGAGDAGRRGGARHARRGRRPLDTRPFDLATDATPDHVPSDLPQHRSAAHPLNPAFGTNAAESPFATNPLESGFAATPFESGFDQDPFDMAFDRDPFDRDRYEFTDDTGPIEVVLDTGPLQRIVGAGSFERVIIPGATSTFDAFNRPRRTGGNLFDPSGGIGATHRGRRHARPDGEPARHPADHPAESPARGRRHRELVGAGSTTDPFTQDAPLRGRRHRELVRAGSTTEPGKGRHRA